MNLPSVALPWVQLGGASELRREVACAAQSDMPILITGEDSDDNRAVAEAIHRRSHRAAARFMAIDCAGVPESILEARLFGCISADGVTLGACGCFERAHCGTVFIAHVDAMSVRLQALLLQFLEDGDIRRVGDVPVHRKVDVRVMTSGHGSLFARFPPMSFNQDLFYRLNVMHLVIPPSSRLQDIVRSEVRVLAPGSRPG
jgi:transcriptional regulator of aromatic amino acid metabolism